MRRRSALVGQKRCQGYCCCCCARIDLENSQSGFSCECFLCVSPSGLGFPAERFSTSYFSYGRMPFLSYCGVDLFSEVSPNELHAWSKSKLAVPLALRGRRRAPGRSFSFSRHKDSIICSSSAELSLQSNQVEARLLQERPHSQVPCAGRGLQRDLSTDTVGCCARRVPPCEVSFSATVT
jgi:hypothetical protein